MWNEFKNFAFKGNAFDLAIGVIMGGAFGKIVDSMVGDLIMPIVGALFGGLDFSNYFAGLGSGVTATTLVAAKEQGAVFAYGSFISVLVNFLVLAFVLLQLVKISNRMKKAEPAAAPAGPTATESLLAEIRDSLAVKAAPAAKAAPARKK